MPIPPLVIWRITLLAASLLFVAPSAYAQDDPPVRPERVESSEKPPSSIRSPLLIGGLGFTAGVWALNLGSSYLLEGEPGFNQLRTPFIGPWQALAHNDCNGSCNFINYFNYFYFTISGLAQAGGLGLVIESLVTPTAVPGARPLSAPPGPRAPEAPSSPDSEPPTDSPSPTPSTPSKPLFFLPMPSPVGQSGVGVSFGGLF